MKLIPFKRAHSDIRTKPDDDSTGFRNLRQIACPPPIPYRIDVPGLLHFRLQGRRVRVWGFGSGSPGCKFQLYHLLTTC